MNLTISKVELIMLREAMACYRLRGFPIAGGVSNTERREWRDLGMRVWKLLQDTADANPIR